MVNRLVYDENSDQNALDSFPEEESIRIEDQVITEGETDKAEETKEANQERLIRSQDQINVIQMILSYRNFVSADERLRQIRVVVE